MLLLDPRARSQIQAYLTKTLKPNGPNLLNSLLRTLSNSLNPSKALQLYNQILPISDHFTFTYSLRACSLLHSPKGLEIHAHIIKTAHHSDPFIQNSLINFYSSVSDPHSAHKVFHEISDPDVVSWTSIVSAFARNGHERESLLAFGSMTVRPNALTLVSVLHACSKLKSVNLGKSIHGYCLRNIGGIGSNIILDNAILQLYMGCEDLGSARRMFEVMPDSDVVSWTTVISGYVRNERLEAAIEVFVLMLRDGEVVPNEATLVSVLRACSLMGSLRLGKWVHSFLFKSCIEMDTIGCNALIDMYAKCGEMGMALKVFNELQCKDLESWGTIIGGMAVNGRVLMAFQLFALMLCHGFRPDSVVFIAVLSACCHSGLVEECIMFFKSMKEVYRIEPRKEHYACLIDTFGRAGRLEDAEQLICRMPIEPDGQVWGAFLNACKMYGGNEAVIERLARRFFGSDVVAGGGTYALLSNILAKNEKWEESSSVREHMRLKKITKNAGYSLLGS